MSIATLTDPFDDSIPLGSLGSDPLAIRLDSRLADVARPKPGARSHQDRATSNPWPMAGSPRLPKPQPGPNGFHGQRRSRRGV